MNARYSPTEEIVMTLTQTSGGAYQIENEVYMWWK
jgi:hypothetical protein